MGYHGYTAFLFLTGMLFLTTMIVNILMLEASQIYYHKMCQRRNCWNFLLTVWPIGITASALGLLYSLVFMWRIGAAKQPSSRSNLLSTLFLAAIWLCVICVGWAPTGVDFKGYYKVLADGTWTELELRRIAFFMPVAGQYYFIQDFYNRVDDRRYVGATTALTFAQTGMAAVVLSTLCFVWSVFLVLFAYLHFRNLRKIQKTTAEPTKEVAASPRHSSVCELGNERLEHFQRVAQ